MYFISPGIIYDWIAIMEYSKHELKTISHITPFPVHNAGPLSVAPKVAVSYVQLQELKHE